MEKEPDECHPARGRNRETPTASSGVIRSRRSPGGAVSGRRPESGGRAALTLAEGSIIGAGFALPLSRALHAGWRYDVSAVARRLREGRFAALRAAVPARGRRSKPSPRFFPVSGTRLHYART